MFINLAPQEVKMACRCAEKLTRMLNKIMKLQPGHDASDAERSWYRGKISGIMDALNELHIGIHDH